MAKKNFKENNPALAFISVADEQQESKDSVSQKIPDGYKLNPDYVETKSKRVQLLVKPSMFETAKKYSQSKGISMNELIATALEEYLKNHNK